MRRLIIYVLFALLTFSIGIGSNSLINSRSKSAERISERDNIYEAVFRYEMAQHNSSVGRTVYFLSYGDDKIPSDKFLQRFRVSNISVKTSADPFLNTGGQFFGENALTELALYLTEVKWLSDSEVVVGGSCRGNWGYLYSYLFRVRREGDKWVIVEVKSIT